MWNILKNYSESIGLWHTSSHKSLEGHCQAQLAVDTIGSIPSQELFKSLEIVFQSQSNFLKCMFPKKIRNAFSEKQCKHYK